MTILIRLGALAAVVAALYLVAWAKKYRSDVSRSWLMDQERRQAGRGIDQSCVREWPMRFD